MSRHFWNAGVQLLNSSRQMSAHKIADILLAKWEERLWNGGTSKEDFDFHDTSSFFSGRLLSLRAIGVSQDQDKLDFVQLL